MAILSWHPPCGALLVTFLFLAGCSSEARQYEIKGSVAYRGEPVAEGQIIFADPQGGSAAVGQIHDGRYTLRATAGAKTIRITATKETGRIMEGGMGAKIPERVDLIPPQYNTQSAELRTVEPKEPQTIDFDLK
jgi:hypothetical protein